MKKYLFLIPILFVMLLSCVPSVSVLAAEPKTPTLHEVEEIPFLQDYLDIEEIKTGYVEYMSDSPYAVPVISQMNTYFYTVFMQDEYYNRMLTNGGDYRIEFEVTFLFDDFSLFYEDYDIISYSSSYQSFSFCIDYIASTDTFLTTYVPQSACNLWYNKHTAGSSSVPIKYTTLDSFVGTRFHDDLFDSDKHIFYQDTNIPDFPYADGIRNNSKGLNVSVIFLPELSGEVDRNVSREDGISSFISNMRMTVINNSSFPVQYKMYIMKKNQITHRHEVNIGSPGKYINSKPFSGASYDDDPVFVYYSNEWVYSSSLDSSATWLNQVPEKQNKATEWHYLSAKNSVDVIFNFSQINLIEKEEYIVYVDAVRCDYGYSSLIFQSAVEDIYPELKQLSQGDIVTVHQSTFSMVHYSDVKYDPADSSNGVLPYSSYDDGYKYGFSYNAHEKDDGTVDYTAKDVSSSASNGSTWGDVSSGPIPSGSTSSSASFLSLSNSFSNFFRFVNQVFNYFPPSITSVYTVGITSIIVIGVIKAVFK